MPKQKTHKGMKKRFKITASGKAVHRKSNRTHRMSKKDGARTRHLRNDGIVTGAFAKHIRECIAPGD